MSRIFLMENFTPVSALIGGVLIGLASAMFLWLNGRIAGISGIAAGAITMNSSESSWRFLFLFGLVAGVGLYRFAGGPLEDIQITSSMPLLIIGGLLVGFGTKMGAGCTSGHGVCGLARFSPRSLLATLTFMIVAAITLIAVRAAMGG
ncbi:MAG: YeeE/YedE thiosulfate transporter family protein [Rhodospirillaceae bacterium]